MTIYKNKFERSTTNVKNGCGGTEKIHSTKKQGHNGTQTLQRLYTRCMSDAREVSKSAKNEYPLNQLKQGPHSPCVMMATNRMLAQARCISRLNTRTLCHHVISLKLSKTMDSYDVVWQRCPSFPGAPLSPFG